MADYDWDFYCVFCGGPFCGDLIASKPRTKRFDRARRLSDLQVTVDNLKAKGQPVPESLERTIEELQSYGDKEPAEGTEEWIEDHTYDPDIITEEEAEWAQSLRCLGLNPYAKSTTKCFLSGECRAAGEWAIEIDTDAENDDPNFPHGISLEAYTYGAHAPPVFPFHSECLKIFQCVLAHKAGVKWGITWSEDDIFDVSAPPIDKETLYSVFESTRAQDEDYSRFLDIDYGDMLLHPPDGRWVAWPGQEWILANPVYAENTVLTEILDVWEETKGTRWAGSSTGTAMGDDPFAQLPFELLENIFSRLDVSCLIKLLLASPHLYRSLGNSQIFWLQVMHRNIPWLFELDLFEKGGELMIYEDEVWPKSQGPENSLDQTAPRSCEGKSLRLLCLWVNWKIMPYDFTEWPFMTVTNRRRIWTICEQIAELYLKQAAYPGDRITSGNTVDLDPQIFESATCFSIPLVSIPMPKRYHPETVFWVRDWNDIHSAFTLKVFWNFNNNLVGLGLMINGKHTPDLRLFGTSDSQDGYTVNTAQVQDGDWIQGFILHYPQIQAPRLEGNEGHEDMNNETDLVGVTVLFQSGRKESFGNIDSDHVKRLMTAAEGMVIVGLTGHVGVRETPMGIVDTISRIGLVQCPLSGGSIEDEERPDENFLVEEVDEEITRSPLLKMLPLTDDCSSIFTMEDIGLGSSNADLSSLQITRTASATGFSLWDLPNLRLQQLSVNSDQLPYELRSYQPLIWAKNNAEARALQRITCCIMKRSGEVSVCGLRADYAPSSMIKRRQIQSRMWEIGPKWKAKDCRHMSISGSKGEVISTIIIGHAFGQNHFASLTLFTNFGREVSWGDVNYEHSEYVCFRAPKGEMIIGILSSFGRAWEDSHMSTVIVLSMPVS
ncbi:hypothetical protein N7540_010132 [Penicillium herquei]|nr:hypothetical protein N7540_010132 [Penicillium herquei]